jgi:hypothetical protein
MRYAVSISWKPEVQTAGGAGKWSGNACRFATEAEAKDYVIDLSMRWTAVSDFRVVESDDPVTYEMVEGRARPIERMS